MKRTSSRFVLVIVTFIASTVFGVSTLARQADRVSILMPAPFADATVNSFGLQQRTQGTHPPGCHPRPTRNRIHLRSRDQQFVARRHPFDGS